MTGTSARETTRPAKRMRPSAGGKLAPTAPPVLFRLPSIALTPSGVDSSGAVGMSMADNAVDMAIAATSSASVAAQSSTEASRAPNAAAVALASEGLMQRKLAGQRLLNILVTALLVVAAVVITWISMQPSKLSPNMANSQESKGSNELQALGDLQVPVISLGQSSSTTSPAAKSQEPSLSTENASASSTTSVAADKSSDPNHNEPGGLTLGFDTGDFPTNPRAASTAQVQLGKPIPMRSNASLVDSQQKPQSSTSNTLPLTTPRYETVSTPSAGQGASDKSSSGGSPGLWDGAKSNASSELELSESLSLSQPLSPAESARASETTRTPSMTLGGPAPSKSQSSLSLDASGSLVITSADGSEAFTNETAALSAADDPLGVTVGGGFKEPSNLASTTATPDMDVAAISQRYIEYSRQKNVAASSNSTLVNPYAPSAGPSSTNRTAAPGTPSGYPQNYGPTGAPTALMNNGSSLNAYPQNGGPQTQSNVGNAGVQYGTTGGMVTHYVRNAPGSLPSGPQQQQPPNGSGAIGQQPAQVSYANNGYSIPGVQPSGSTPAGSPLGHAASVSGQLMSGPPTSGPALGGQMIPPRAGASATMPQSGAASQYTPATNPAYQNPAYQNPTYQNPANMNPANANPANVNPANVNPANVNPANVNPGYANPQYGAPAFNPQAAPSRPSLINPSAPTMNGPATGAPTTAPGMRTSVPVTSGYPGGQAPLSLIGQSGFATAPSGDVVNSAPIPVRGTVGQGNAAAPSEMPAGMPPMGASGAVPATQGVNAYRNQPSYGTAPQFQ